MRKLLLCSAIALISLAGSAWAEDVTGKITSIDPSSKSIKLEDGKMFVLPWDVGQKVKIVANTQPEAAGTITMIQTADDQATADATKGEAVGAITQMSLNDKNITLEGGQGFRLGWDTGQTVKITFQTTQEGTPLVTEISDVAGK